MFDKMKNWSLGVLSLRFKKILARAVVCTCRCLCLWKSLTAVYFVLHSGVLSHLLLQSSSSSAPPPRDLQVDSSDSHQNLGCRKIESFVKDIKGKISMSKRHLQHFDVHWSRWILPPVMSCNSVFHLVPLPMLWSQQHVSMPPTHS